MCPTKDNAMRIVERGRRSSVVSESGTLLRLYHDTGRRNLLPLSVDDRGVVRLSGNRRLDAFLEPSGSYRGAQETEGRAAIPPHVERTLRTVLGDPPSSVNDVARSLGVRVSTAWCYLCKMVEAYPATNVHVAHLVHEPLLRAMCEVSDRGSLTEVMDRLNAGPLKGSTEWRCVEDRFSHLRLARLCLMST